MWALEGEIRGLRDAIAVSGATLKEGFVGTEGQAKDGLGQSHEPDAQAIVDVENIVGRHGT
jgi:hypothetical protein